MTRDRDQGRPINERSSGTIQAIGGRVDRMERVRVAGSSFRERKTLEPRLRELRDRRWYHDRDHRGPQHYRHWRPPHVVYRDRPDLVRHSPRHVYTYWDPYGHLSYRIIWPRYWYPICYSYGPYWRFSWIHPYYHRKYVFVSVGGYWPIGYTYRRYYWYGWHPYAWYGYYPTPREVTGDTYNYYTYNYYNDNDNTAYAAELPSQPEPAEPAIQTQADVRFENGVKIFETGDYDMAAKEFAAAMALSPEDVIMPFAYAQSLFAGERYAEAAGVIRQALEEMSPQEQGVYYPRGLYSEDDVLFGQIEKLLDRADAHGFNPDLELLLGYHLLGIGEPDYARGPLEEAAQDPRNTKAAQILLDLAGKAEAAGTEADEEVSSSSVVPESSKADVLAKMETTRASSAVSVSGKVGNIQPATVGSAGTLTETPVAMKEDDEVNTIHISDVPAG